MNKYTVLAGICLLSLAGCDDSSKSSVGFSLPQGDAEAGRGVFIAFSCSDCHSVDGDEALREGYDPIMTIPLGGKGVHVATYGQLVTSVINPSHKISQKYVTKAVEKDGKSAMRNYNDIMTVSELVNLVAYLQGKYELEYYPYSSYDTK